MLHVVWDWNGTLFEDLHLVVEAVNVVLAAGDLPPIHVEQYTNGYTRPVKLFYEALYGRPLTDAEWDDLDQMFHQAYREGLHRAGLAEHAHAALDRIDELGATQSLLSMYRHDELVPLIRHLGIEERFVLVDGLRGPGGGSKAPHLQSHLTRLAHGWPDTVVIGDAVDDARSALAHGCIAVLVDSGSHPRRELERVGVPVADDLLDALRLAQLL